MNYYVPLPAFNPGPGLDFTPISNALTQVSQTNYRNAMLDFEGRSADRADKQLAIQQQSADDEHQAHVADLSHKLATYMAGYAQDILDDPNPQSRLSRAQKYIGAHPDVAPLMQKNGIDPNDPIGALKSVVAETRGYLNPLDVQAKQASIAEARANVAKTNAEIEGLRRQRQMIDNLLPGMMPDYSPSASPAASPTTGGNALAPSAPSAGNAAPPGNAFATQPRPSPALPPVGSPPMNAMMAYGTQVPGTTVSSPNALLAPPQSTPPPVGALRGPAQGGGPSTSLPNPGDPTSFTGDSAAGMTTPSRLSPDTMRAFAIDLMANNGKGAASILTQDPGSQYAKSFANQTGQDNAALNFKQKMTGPLLAQIQRMRQMATDAGEDVLTNATGPNYSSDDDGNSLLDTSGQRYQNMRAWGHTIDPLRLLGLDDPKPYDNAAKLNLQFQHMKKMLGASVKALPGSKGGDASTDQDQALVLDAVGEALHAQDPQTFFKILHDAENGLRARAGMPALPEPKDYLPDSWPRDASSSSPKVPAEALQMLRANPSAKARAHFDEVFGNGSAASALGGQ